MPLAGFRITISILDPPIQVVLEPRSRTESQREQLLGLGRMLVGPEMGCLNGVDLLDKSVMWTAGYGQNHAMVYPGVSQVIS